MPHLVVGGHICPRSKDMMDTVSIVKDVENLHDTDMYTYLGVNMDGNLLFKSFLKAII